MSFIISLYVREGIVLASDSRLTLNTQQNAGANQIINIAAGMTDSNNKTYLAFNRIGISTFGTADINGVPLAGFIETFIDQNQNNPNNNNIRDVANRLLTFFRAINPNLQTGFHIAGYEIANNIPSQKIYRVDIATNNITHLNPQVNGIDIQGASWDGESDILLRLINQVFMQAPNGTYQPLPVFNIPWNFFTLQDAIDFATFAVRTTIDTIKFQPRAKTVGGPIDVLVIKPNEAIWINRKVLRA